MPRTREDFIPAPAGGFLDGATAEITDAFFDIASGEYADAILMGGDSKTKPSVVLKVVIESPDLEKPAEQQFSVGSQDIWEVSDDGKSITNIKKPDSELFLESCMAASLVNALAEALGGGDMEKGQDVFMKRDIPMTNASFYLGLGTFDWEVKEIKRMIGKREVISRPPLPVRLVNEPVKRTTAARSASKAAAPVAVENNELDQIIIDNAAGKTETELKQFAVKVQEIKDNKTYMTSVVRGGKLEELENAGKIMKDPDTNTYL